MVSDILDRTEVEALQSPAISGVPLHDSVPPFVDEGGQQERKSGQRWPEVQGEVMFGANLSITISCFVEDQVCLDGFGQGFSRHSACLDAGQQHNHLQDSDHRCHLAMHSPLCIATRSKYRRAIGVSVSNSPAEQVKPPLRKLFLFAEAVKDE